MSTDPDIQFGELEEEQPDEALRPDRNAHFAIAPYGEPQEDELPIFVDMDVLIEMESHALTDTTVELGGVMLGGQLHDEEGRPYVLVQDSVRAQHYEATKGSFKFTHDTWGQITRERDDFPSDWDMVGWYHTHPDWGVFLSGMDMFICDNYFNKQLDVALVIDPCRQDRGFFYWTGDPRERKRRVGGFYIIASRHRQAELEQFTAELEGGYTMRTDPNMRAGYNVSSSGGGGAPTIVNITEQRPGWLGQAVVWCIVFQTIVLMLFGYLAIVPRETPKPQAAKDKQLALEVQERELKSKQDFLDDFMQNMTSEEKVVSELETQTMEVERLKQDLAVATAGVPALQRQRDKYEKDAKKYKESADSFEKDYKRKKEQLADAEEKYDRLKKSIEDGEAPETWYDKYLGGHWVVIGVVVGVFLAVAGFFAYRGYVGQDAFPEELLDEPPEADQFDPPPPSDDGQDANESDEEPRPPAE